MVVVLCTNSVFAQYEMSFSHYFDMQPSYNPAAVGKQKKLNINAAYAMNFTGFKNNPRTMYVGADMPVAFFNHYHGVGLQLTNDQIGLFKHQRLSGQYAYTHRLFGGVLSAGVLVGLISERFDGSKLDAEDSSDPAFATASATGNGLDLGGGIYYHHKKWYVGASVLHANAPKISLGETNELQVDRTYYFTGGYNIQLKNPFLNIRSSVLFRTDGIAYRGDVTARLVYNNDNKLMYGGVGYSPTNSVTFLIGGNVRGVMLGYSYELPTSGVNPGNGSHEIFIGYQMDINLAKRGKNKHQSVRIL